MKRRTSIALGLVFLFAFVFFLNLAAPEDVAAISKCCRADCCDPYSYQGGEWVRVSGEWVCFAVGSFHDCFIGYCDCP